jgi:hypothetical protein
MNERTSGVENKREQKMAAGQNEVWGGPVVIEDDHVRRPDAVLRVNEEGCVRCQLDDVAVALHASHETGLRNCTLHCKFTNFQRRKRTLDHDVLLESDVAMLHYQALACGNS